MDRTNDKVWHNAVKWIESNGGYVHPKLEYDDIHRQVYLGKQPCVRDDGNAISSKLATTTTKTKTTTTTTKTKITTAAAAAAVGEVVGSVDAGTTLLKIPDACLVTLHSAEDDTAFGKSLFGVVHSFLPSNGNTIDNKNTIDEMHNDDDHVEKKNDSNNSSSSSSFNSDDEISGLYHDAQDVILALFLAYLTHRLDHPPSPPEERSLANHDNAPWLFYQPYLATLPSSSSSSPPPSSTDESTTSTTSTPLSKSTTTTPAKNNDDFHCHLPRQWSAPILKRRLEGTSLYKRVLKEQRGIKREYELVKEAWMTKHNNECNARNAKNDDGIINKSNPIFPPFEYYDNMMAALTSRGFVGLGHDGVDALIPMLDLLNHVRGGGGGEGVDRGTETSDSDGNTVARARKENIDSNNLAERTYQHNSNNSINETTSKRRGGPDVRYERYEEAVVLRTNRTSDEPPSSKRPRTMDGSNNKREHDVEGGGGVRVSTSRPLSFGAALHMTYGAKGNAALLGRYGFCIPHNVEPDGSCNDVLELEIKPKEQPVKLQRGPKSYCYGPFVKALELCRDGVDENSNENGASAMDDDWRDVQEDEGDDMIDSGLEAFLDSCDNEFEEDGIADDDDDECDENDDDYFYNPSTNPNAAAGTNNSHQPSLMNDIRAVDALKGLSMPGPAAPIISVSN